MKYIKWILILFIITSAGYLIANEYTPTTKTQPVVNSQTETAKIADGIVVYYFHGNRRCTTCGAIEKYSQESAMPYIKKNHLTWKIINIDIPANKHFVYDFNLKSSGPVVVEYKNGKVKRFQPLDKVWQLVRNKEAFAKYVTDEVERFIK